MKRSNTKASGAIGEKAAPIELESGQIRGEVITIAGEEK